MTCTDYYQEITPKEELNKIVQCCRCKNRHKWSERISFTKGVFTFYGCPRCRSESYYRIPQPVPVDG